MEFVLCTQGVMWKEKPKPGVEWGSGGGGIRIQTTYEEAIGWEME